MIGTDANGEEGLENDGHFDHEGAYFSDPNLNKVSNDINNEDANEGENVHAPSIKNSIHRIVIRNDPGAHMLSVDPNTTYALEFLENNIIPSHRLVTNSELKELYIDQQFANKEECVFSIK